MALRRKDLGMSVRLYLANPLSQQRKKAGHEEEGKDPQKPSVAIETTV